MTPVQTFSVLLQALTLHNPSEHLSDELHLRPPHLTLLPDLTNALCGWLDKSQQPHSII